jgi:DNA polymerase
MIAVRFDPEFVSWREKARALLSANVPPSEVLWSSDGQQGGLFDASIMHGSAQIRVPREFLALAEVCACHRDEARWALLYRVLYRLTHGDAHLLKLETDDDTLALSAMHKQVTHDIHRMRAFVRFRETKGRFIAWHKPDHLIVEQAAPFFVKRFGSMQWSILTPDRSAHWDLHQLEFGPGVPRSAAPNADNLEDLWRAYYASTFNPARVNPDLMRQHMPRRYWSTLPEAEVFSNLIAGAGRRETQMHEAQPVSAAQFVPVNATIPILRDAVHSCQGCDLHHYATQPVFGEGPSDARIVFVGEQPGDNEDRQGRPFVGPAGQLFDRALADVGLLRESVYITGAVKHFRFEERGKRRIHKTASRAQIAACQPWLEAELQLIRPKLIVCMGATAALSVIGRGVRLMEERGQIRPHRFADGVMATVHPSFLLRLPDEERRNEEYTRLVEELGYGLRFAS